MENNGRLLPKDSLVEEVPAKKPLHRTELPPTLQGFFYGDGVRDEEDDYLPCKNYGRFARLPGTTTSVDPSLSFLSKALHRHIFLLDACNGLLLLGHKPVSYFWPEFAVCNPATQQWAAVPSCVDWVDDDPRNDPRNFTKQTHISLLFDPAVSSHFQVVIFWNWHLIDDDREGTTTVHVYSSETEVWRNSESDWSPEERRGPWELWRRQISFNRFILQGSPGAFVDGMLYLNLAWCQRILQVDTEGKTRGMLPVPADKAYTSKKLLFVGRSQGRLHCIVEERRHGHLLGQRVSRRYRKKWRSHGLFIWVLIGEMDRQEWVMKHKVSRGQLLGNIITMHPDCNMLFFDLQRGDDRLIILYDLHRKEVRLVDTYKRHATDKIIPFVPYLSELFLGVLGAYK